MRITVICGIPMRERLDRVIYTGSDESVKAADIPVVFPVNAFLAENMAAGDRITVLLLAKRDGYSFADRNITLFREELASVNAGIGAETDIMVIDTDFDEARAVHDKLMGSLIDGIGDGSLIYADITYGPKDLPIVMFTALRFAEKFLRCTVGKILYGKANFFGGHAVNTVMCDMTPLYCLDSVTELVDCDEPDRAREMLSTLLTFGGR